MIAALTRLTVIALAMALGVAGCVPDIAANDQEILANVKTMVVLPLTDGPSTEAQGSSWVARGAVIHELFQMERWAVTNVSRDLVEQAAARAGVDLIDCYDPVAAAALARELNADAAVCGEILHWGTRQETGKSSTMLVIKGEETKTHHYVSLSLRVVDARDGEILCTGAGEGMSKEGYSSAAEVAAGEALNSLATFARYSK